MRTLVRSLAALLLLAPHLPARPQCPVAKWIPDAPGGAFGRSVAVDGTTALVGAPFADPAGPSSGEVTVFELTPAGWQAVQKLQPAGAAAFDYFGWSVDLEGDRALVGAYAYQAGAGAAHVFERQGGTWTETAALEDPQGLLGDQLGVDVSLSGDVALVGANGVDGAAQKTGAACVFERQGGAWVLVQKLTAPAETQNDYFGWSVAVSGNTAVVGRSGGDPAGVPDAGTAHVFERGPAGWQHVQELAAPGAAPGDLFGIEVALEDDTLLAGAWLDDAPGAPDAGAVHVFERQAGLFVPTQELAGSPPLPGGILGWSLDLDGDRALAGAYGNGPAGAGSGLALVFDRTPQGWSQSAVLLPLDGAPGDNFGYAVALAGDVALAGAWFDGDLGADTGAVHPFSVAGTGCPLLAAAPAVVSVAAGGTQHFALRAGPAHAGLPYLLLGSAGGTAPGTPAGPVVLPLVAADTYFLFTLTAPGAPPLSGSFAALDAAGEGAAQWTAGPGLPPALAGLSLHHAYVVLGGSLVPVLASNPVPLEFVP